jgi:hypothetical protein
MRKIALVLGLALLAVPGAALAAKPPHPGNSPTTPTTQAPTIPSAKSLALQACKDARSKDASLFKTTYGSTALGQCVRRINTHAQSALNSAAKQCKAWQNDPTGFASTHNGSTFNQVYGTNTKAKGNGAGSNAYGKCVSSLAKQKVNSQEKATMSAAKQCKTSRNSDPTTFASTYGSTKHAFGACVSKLTKSSK